MDLKKITEDLNFSVDGLKKNLEGKVITYSDLELELITAMDHCMPYEFHSNIVCGDIREASDNISCFIEKKDTEIPYITVTYNYITDSTVRVLEVYVEEVKE